MTVFTFNNMCNFPTVIVLNTPLYNHVFNFLHHTAAGQTALNLLKPGYE